MKTKRSLTYAKRFDSRSMRAYYVEPRAGTGITTSRQETIGYAENLASYFLSKGREAHVHRYFDIALLFVSR